MNLSDRKYLRFVLIAFAALGLTGLGVWLYEPLSVQYIIYRVRRSPGKYCGPAYAIIADKWLVRCIEAAVRGNESAMRVVIEHPRVSMSDAGGSLWGGYDVVYVAAVRQPELFFRVLAEGQDRDVLEVLWAICDEASRRGQVKDALDSGPWEAVVWQLSINCLESVSPRARQMSEAALKFANRRWVIHQDQTPQEKPLQR